MTCLELLQLVTYSSIVLAIVHLPVKAHANVNVRTVILVEEVEEGFRVPTDKVSDATKFLHSLSHISEFRMRPRINPND